MNKSKLSVMYDDVLPKVNVLYHLSKERKKSEFLKESELSNDDSLKEDF
jgi:hypothetical protein